MSQATPSPFDIDEEFDPTSADTVRPRISRVHEHEPELICEECGYDLRGLPAGTPCSECGHINVGLWKSATREVTCSRYVTCGLALLVFVTLYAVTSVLVQPFTGEVGGILPAMNVPGPKLWAVPLLQRPIGNSPELPGIVGTRTAMLSMLAIWLITAPRAGASTLRAWTRWVSLVLFGIAFGVLLASQGFWPSQLPPYRLLLVALVELPAGAMLYAYLARLATWVPGRERRRIFELLRWLVPLVMLGGVVLMTAGWAFDEAHRLDEHRFGLPIAAVYGAIALPCGLAACAAVASLAASYAAVAFPNAWRIVTGARSLGTRVWRAASASDGRACRAACVCAGLLMLLVTVFLGNDQILWYTARVGLAGNLPFYNFPGPKLWAAAGVPEMGGRYTWEPIVSHTIFVASNLAAFWLLTVRIDPDDRSRLRILLRWLPAIAIGAALGSASGFEVISRSDRDAGELLGNLRSEAFTLITVLCELPGTVLLYVYLARLARRHAPDAPRLRRHFLIVSAVGPALVVSSLFAFFFSRHVLPAHRATPLVLAVCGIFGAIAICTAVWASALILSLAGKIARREVFAHARVNRVESRVDSHQCRVDASIFSNVKG